MFLMQRYEETSLTKLGCFKIHIRIQNDYLVLSRFRLALLLVPYCPLLENTSGFIKAWIFSSGCSHLYSIQLQPPQFDIWIFCLLVPNFTVFHFLCSHGSSLWSHYNLCDNIDQLCWLIDIEYHLLCNQLLLKIWHWVIGK